MKQKLIKIKEILVASMPKESEEELRIYVFSTSSGSSSGGSSYFSNSSGSSSSSSGIMLGSSENLSFGYYDNDLYENPLPDEYMVVTSKFGMRNGKFHYGTDYGCPEGTPVYSIDDGIVDYIGYDYERGGGKFIKIKHTTLSGEVYYSAYFHLSDNSLVRIGDRVTSDTMIGKSGNTGHSTGPHLHLAIYTTAASSYFMSLANHKEIDMDGDGTIDRIYYDPEQVLQK